MRIPGSSRTNEQLLIMRLITSTGLALLLLFGATATMGHTDSRGGEGVPVAVTGHDSSAVESPAADPSPQQIVALSGEMNASLGVALCTLGILCGLTAIILIVRLLWSSRLASPLRAGPRPLPRVSVFASPLRTTAFSLSQLGLSRT